MLSLLNDGVKKCSLFEMFVNLTGLCHFSCVLCLIYSILMVDFVAAAFSYIILDAVRFLVLSLFLICRCFDSYTYLSLLMIDWLRNI